MEHLNPIGFGPVLTEFMNRLFMALSVSPEVAPAEPITKPDIKPDVRPDQDDPFYFPAPKVDPTPKGLYSFF